MAAFPFTELAMIVAFLAGLAVLLVAVPFIRRRRDKRPRRAG